MEKRYSTKVKKYLNLIIYSQRMDILFSNKQTNKLLNIINFFVFSSLYLTSYKFHKDPTGKHLFTNSKEEAIALA